MGAERGVLAIPGMRRLQRVLPPEAIGRALGVLETVAMLGLGLGAALAPAALAAGRLEAGSSSAPGPRPDQRQR